MSFRFSAKDCRRNAISAEGFRRIPIRSTYEDERLNNMTVDESRRSRERRVCRAIDVSRGARPKGFTTRRLVQVEISSANQ